jgi:glycine cleavage system transcriptional repressor
VRHLALSALGADRPGIVAAVTGALVAHGVNIEDSRMAILRGQFAIVVVLGAPEGLDRSRLEEDLERTREALGLEALMLTEAAETPAAGGCALSATHVVSVYGVDHPGIVHAVATALAERGVNIADLTTRLADEHGGEPLYAMALEVTLPSGLDPAELERDLVAVAGEQGVEVSFRALEQDPL